MSSVSELTLTSWRVVFVASVPPLPTEEAQLSWTAVGTMGGHYKLL